MMYNQRIDLLLSGHLHSFKSNEIAQSKEYIQFPAICGVDEYAWKIHKSSDAGTKVIVLEENVKDKMIYDVNLQYL